MAKNRPILISVIQYQDELKAGTLSIFDVIEKAHTLGADGVELRREVWANYQDELSAARERIEAVGLLVIYATFSALFSADESARKLLFHDIETAKALGSPLLRVFPGAAPTSLDDMAWESAIEAVEYAAAQGVTLALENFGKTPGGTVNEILHILNRIPLDALKTNIDIGNYSTHGEDVPEAVQAVGSRAVYAHLKDKAGDKSDATTHLGGGEMPMREIITALNALPQQVIYCFEFVGDGEADARIEKSIAYLRGF